MGLSSLSSQFLSLPLAGFLAFFPQHGPQTPVFSSTPSEETEEGQADSCLQARRGICFFKLAEGRYVPVPRFTDLRDLQGVTSR